MTTAAESRPVKQRKPKVCKACPTEFVPRSMGHKACSPKCAQAIVEADRAKKERKELAVAKERIKPRAQWLKEAQQSFNAYIRSRDADLPCISCGRLTGQAHAGHFFSVGARPNLRFHEANVHRQCALCNLHLHGNLINYRSGLIARIGLASVEALEADQAARRYSIDDLKQIKADYARKRRELEKAA